MVKGTVPDAHKPSKRSKAKKKRRDAQLNKPFPKDHNPHEWVDKEIHENSLKYFNTDPNNTNWEDNLRAKMMEPMPLQPWVDTTSPKTEEEIVKERVTEDLKDWPWRESNRQPIMIGPHMFNTMPRSEDDIRPPVEAGEGCDQQQSLFFTKIVAHADIFSMIMELVCAHHDSAWKFGATCIQAYNQMVYSFMDFWDMSKGWFNQCSLTKELKDENNKVCNRSVCPVLIVSTTRHQNLKSPNKPRPSYRTQLNSMFKLCKAVRNVHDNIRTLHFHNVPFLTDSILALLIPTMRNLTNLGVYKCQLLHVGHAIPLLGIITLDRPKGKEHQVNLDFYPNFHIGPVETGKPWEMGGFGVTWDNWNRDSRLAIWQLVSHILPKARSQGIDMESPWTGFRKWLDDGPCWRVEQTLKVMMDPKVGPREFAAQVDAGNILHHGSVDMMFNYKRAILSGGMEWAESVYDCAQCGPNLGIFFFYLEIRNHRIFGEQPTCLGCQLTMVLEGEKDHFKLHKRKIIRNWLSNIQLNDDGSSTRVWNYNNLAQAIAEFQNEKKNKRGGKLKNPDPSTRKNIKEWGTSLDEMRQKWIEEKGWDREVEERQQPYTKDEMGRRGEKMRTPRIGDKMQDPMVLSPEERKWHAVRADERYAHGFMW
ncbi:hypothetical protein HYFRA_00001893 [Hymenoscyphus fraxineus]|uniref:Uncharacterized protein n=1 Tax=Hymenoscyphus fraxineus TaxID=746836 RepID=A0A9N9PJL8_9HELO|nr:hypothetical protein HYFRA_00001893 [Hymenoscyphus fraxineus]